jgi:predicted outer membrane lipoprotein
MGLLGLANLVYFGEHYADVFQRLVSAQRKRDYPLACAGKNITALLLELLNMKDEGEPQTVQSRPPFDGQWGSDMFFFFCHMFYRERAFEDMYCFCLRRLDRMMVAMDANYAEFNTVVAALRSRLVEALAQRPLSFREFKRLMAAASSESEGSVHSSSGCDSMAVQAGTPSATSLFGGGGGLWATGSSRRSSCSAASSAVPVNECSTGLNGPRPIASRSMSSVSRRLSRVWITTGSDSRWASRRCRSKYSR